MLSRMQGIKSMSAIQAPLMQRPSHSSRDMKTLLSRTKGTLEAISTSLNTRKRSDEEKAFAEFGQRYKWNKGSGSDKSEDKEEETWQGREKKRVSFEDQAVSAFNPPEISPSAELQALALESQALKEKADAATSIQETKEIMALYMKKLERTQTLSALLIEEALRVRKND